ncbi:MAG TPA: hypothetical protein DCM08_11755, partial [Microscillaceae bacterium]|nr:hypothetical protein [Microscillaceae bacterium]
QVRIEDLSKKPMIYAERIYINFDYKRLLKGGNITLDQVNLTKASVNLVVDEKTKQLNINEWVDALDRLSPPPKEKKKKKKSTKFVIRKAQIKDSYFSYYDNTKARDESVDFDPVHFDLDNLNGSLERFTVAGDTIQLEAENLKAIERKAGLFLKNLTTFFRMTKTSMEFNKLNLALNDSKVTENLVFRFKSMKDMSDFVNKVAIVGSFKDTEIHTEDLAKFAPALKKFKDVWKISGTFVGLVNDFVMRNFDLRFGKDSHIKGYASLKGLPDVEKTVMKFDLKNSVLHGEELKNYIDNQQVVNILDQAGLMNFDVDFEGTTQEFKTTGEFKTGLGNFTIDLAMVLPTQSYKATLKAEELNLGAILSTPMLGKTTLTADIEGKGFSEETADFVIDTKIEHFFANGYDYKDLEIDGRFARGHFDGEFVARDPNLNLIVKGELDLNPDKTKPDLPPGRFNFQSDITRISLKDLNLSAKETLIKGKIRSDTRGLTLDDIIGEADLEEAIVLYEGKSLEIKKAKLFAIQTDNNRLLTFDSDFFSARFSGKYLFSQWLADLQALAKELAFKFEGNTSKEDAYYESKDIGTDYKLNYAINIKNANPIIDLFAPNVYLKHNISLYGDFSGGDTTRFNLQTGRQGIDSIWVGSNKFYDIDLKLVGEKSSKTDQLKIDAKINSSRQDIGALKTEGFMLDVDWDDDILNFRTIAQQADTSGNFIKLEGGVKLSEGRIDILFKPSTIKLLQNRWAFARNNQITLTNGEIIFNNFGVYNTHFRDSRLFFHGAISEDPEKALLIKLEDIEILPFATIIKQRIGGVANATIEVKNLYQDILMKGDLRIDEFYYKNAFLGYIEANTHWDGFQKPLFLTLDATLRSDDPYFSLKGNYNPVNDGLDFRALFDQFELQLAEPFVEDLLAQMTGTAKGRIDIKGTGSSPVVKGELEVMNGGFLFKMMNTYYTFSDKLFLEPNRFYMKNFTLFDNQNNKMTLNGGFTHDGFKNILLDLKGSFKNFLVMQKDIPKENEAFYGTATASGTLSVTGLLNSLVVNIDAKNEKGTKVFFPLDGYSEVSQKDYITFVKPKADKTIKAKRKVELNNLKLNMNVDVNEEAEFEIIFDLRAGDIIKASGNGKVRMELDTDGDLNMFGSYTISKGKYNFTLLNLVNKGFDIEKGSRLDFVGDLFETRLKVAASYTQVTALTPLINARNITNDPMFSMRFPIKVLLKMEGLMLEPEVKFGLDLSQVRNISNPIMQAAVIQLDNNINTNEQELNRQVFSLIVLKRLAPPDGFAIGGQAATSSLSELLSNQLNNWLSQVDSNLELNLDLDASRVSVSYKMLDGRLRITREGNLSSTQNRNATATAIGDWTIEYMLTQDGKLRAKAYNRSNQGALGMINLNNAANNITGFSIMYTKSFNSFKELFTSQKKMNQENERREREETERKEKELKNKEGKKEETPPTEPLDQ